jgi:hypothetical protein
VADAEEEEKASGEQQQGPSDHDFVSWKLGTWLLRPIISPPLVMLSHEGEPTMTQSRQDQRAGNRPAARRPRSKHSTALSPGAATETKTSVPDVVAGAGDVVDGTEEGLGIVPTKVTLVKTSRCKVVVRRSVSLAFGIRRTLILFHCRGSRLNGHLAIRPWKCGSSIHRYDGRAKGCRQQVYTVLTYLGKEAYCPRNYLARHSCEHRHILLVQLSTSNPNC